MEYQIDPFPESPHISAHATFDATAQQESAHDFRNQPVNNTQHAVVNNTTNGGGGGDGFTNLEDLIRKVLREELSTVYSDGTSNSATQSLLSLIGSSLAAEVTHEVTQNVKLQQEVQGTSAEAEERRHYRGVSELEPYVEGFGENSLSAYLNRFEEEWERERECCSKQDSRSKYGHVEEDRLVQVLRTKIPTRFHVALEIDVSTYREISTYGEAIHSLRKLWRLRNMELADDSAEQDDRDFGEGDLNWDVVDLYRSVTSQKFRPKEESLDVYLLRLYSSANKYCKRMDMNHEERKMFAATTLYDSLRFGLPSKMHIFSRATDLKTFSQLREAAAQTYAKLVREGIYPLHIPKDSTDSSSSDSSDDEDEPETVAPRNPSPSIMHVAAPPANENSSNHALRSNETGRLQTLHGELRERSAPVPAIPTFDITFEVPANSRDVHSNAARQQNDVVPITHAENSRENAPELFYNRGGEEYYSREGATTSNITVCKNGMHCSNADCIDEHPDPHARRQHLRQEREEEQQSTGGKKRRSTQYTEFTSRMPSEESDAPCRYAGHRGHTNGNCKKQYRESLLTQSSHLQDAIGQVYSQMLRAGVYPSNADDGEESGSNELTSRATSLFNGSAHYQYETQENSATTFDGASTKNVEKRNKRKAYESVYDEMPDYYERIDYYAQDASSNETNQPKTGKFGKNGTKSNKKPSQNESTLTASAASRTKRRKTDRTVTLAVDDPDAPCKYPKHFGHTNANCQKQMRENRTQIRRLPGPNPENICQMHPDADHTNAQCRKGVRLRKK